MISEGRGGPGFDLGRFRRSIASGGSIAFVDAMQSVGLLAVILLGAILLSITAPHFLTKTNLVNVLYSATIVAVVAIGETLVILVAGIDLSVGSILALASVLSVGLTVNQHLPVWLAPILALLAGAIFGLANGLAVTRLRIPALIATLATLSIAQGLAFIYSGGTNIAPVPNVFVNAQSASIGGIPAVVIFALVLAFVAHVVLTKTRFGRSIYATGGNPIAARLAGIRTDRVIIAAFVISGLMAAVGGLLTTARLEAGAATAGQGSELTVIAAVVIGGTSLFGGEGTIFGMLLGVLLLALVQNAVDLLNVPPNYDSVVSGLVIAAAATLDVYRRNYVEMQLRRRTITAKAIPGRAPQLDASLQAGETATDVGAPEL